MIRFDSISSLLNSTVFSGYDKGSYLSVTDVLNKPRNDGSNCLHLAVNNGHEKVK